MLMFTLAISFLTTSHLPWFMDLTFQVPMQYCSLQHRILLLSPVISTAVYCFCFGSIPSFFLNLFLHWSPVACWAPTNLVNSSFCVLSFCLFILFMGFLRQEYWSGCHSLLQWTTFCQNLIREQLFILQNEPEISFMQQTTCLIEVLSKQLFCVPLKRLLS